MPGELMYGVSEWVLLPLVAGLLYGGAEVGFRYGRRYNDRTSPEVQSHVATVEGALLGLLALLLGFGFAVAQAPALGGQPEAAPRVRRGPGRGLPDRVRAARERAAHVQLELWAVSGHILADTGRSGEVRLRQSLPAG